MQAHEEPSSQNLLTRLSAGMLALFYRSGHWSDETIFAMANGHAGKTANKAAVRDSHCTLTYAELLSLANSIASNLAAAGLRRGDRIACWMSNRVEMAPFLLACSRNGYVLCPSLHRNHTVEEILQLLKRTQARVLVAEDGFGADVQDRDVFEQAGALPSIARIFRLPAPAKRSAIDLRRDLELDDVPPPRAVGQANDIVYLAFTSGTTGDPKGVMHSNNTLLANARALASAWAFDNSTINYTLSPLSHNLGFGALVLTLLVGGEIVLHDLPRGASLLSRLRETSTTFIYGVPAHAIDLLQEISQAGGANLPNLRGFRISGAAATSTVVEGLMSYGVVAQSGYGMTEAGSHHFTLPTDGPEVIVGTSGGPAAGYEVKIFSVDNPDKALQVGEVGHIGGRGASLMLGYFDNQTATETSFNEDGWFMTGDLGRIDANGHLQVTGRLKEVIIRGGHNIHPAKIELLAMRHSTVERAAAIPVKDERLGEKVCLVVMARDDARIDPQSLLAHLDAEGLSRFDMPEYFAQVREIPLNANGKILKRALLPWIEDGRLTPQPVRWLAKP